MSVAERIIRLFSENKVEFIVLAAVVVAAVAIVLGFVLKNTGVYAAVLMLAFGGIGLFTSFFEKGKRLTSLLFPLWGTIGGAGYLVLFLCLRVREWVWRRKKRRAEIGRRLQYALPDRENAYVRARLDTALKIQENEASMGAGAELFSTDRKGAGVRFGYVRKMTAKIQEAPLTPVERLDVEEIARLVSLYTHKEKWSNADIKIINEIFSKLLKLSAKYQIAV